MPKVKNMNGYSYNVGCIKLCVQISFIHEAIGFCVLTLYDLSVNLQEYDTNDILINNNKILIYYYNKAQEGGGSKIYHRQQVCPRPGFYQSQKTPRAGYAPS